VPPSTVRDTVPPNVEAAALTALAKLPADRFGSASEFAAALTQTSGTATTISGARRVSSAGPAWQKFVAPAVAVGGLLIAAVAWSTRGSPSPDTAPVMRFEIPIPDSLRLQKVVLTPDGKRLLLSTDHGPFVYTLADARLNPLEIPGVKRATDVDISPDGEFFVFRDGLAVKAMPVNGGSVRTLDDSLLTVRVGDDGFVYGRRFASLRRIPLRGGTAEPLRMNDSLRLALDSLFGEIGEPFPVPGGRGVVFSITTYAPLTTRIAVLDIGSGDVSFAPGEGIPSAQPIGFTATDDLLLRGTDAIYAIPFDRKRLRMTAAAQQVVSNVAAVTMWCVGESCSGSSTNAQSLAYVVSPLPTPALVNRRGEWRSLPGIPPNLIFQSALPSPDGRMLVAQVEDISGLRQDIWTYRMPAGPPTRITSSANGFFWAPRWLADGQTIRYASVSKDEEAIYAMPADGSRPPQLVLKRHGGFSYSISHHPDGQRVATNSCLTPRDTTTSTFVAGSECKEFGLAILFANRPDSVIRIDDLRNRARNGEFSPDGRFLAYLARDIKAHDLYVRPLDGGDARWRVSLNGASRARWSRDGRTLFFAANDSLFAAEWRAGTAVPVGSVRSLFRLGVLQGAWDVMPGDSTFLMTAPNQSEKTRIVVIANFVEQLRGASPSRSR
jgi:eukaryotic-like serine/threonine-protein kinase